MQAATHVWMNKTPTMSAVPSEITTGSRVSKRPSGRASLKLRRDESGTFILQDNEVGTSSKSIKSSVSWNFEDLSLEQGVVACSKHPPPSPLVPAGSATRSRLLSRAPNASHPRRLPN